MEETLDLREFKKHLEAVLATKTDAEAWEAVKKLANLLWESDDSELPLDLQYIVADYSTDLERFNPKDEPPKFQGRAKLEALIQRGLDTVNKHL